MDLPNKRSSQPRQFSLQALELAPDAQKELQAYFDEIRMPYGFERGRLCVPGSVSWESIYEALQHFYEGRAEVFPF